MYAPDVSNVHHFSNCFAKGQYLLESRQAGDKYCVSLVNSRKNVEYAATLALAKCMVGAAGRPGVDSGFGKVSWCCLISLPQWSQMSKVIRPASILTLQIFDFDFVDFVMPAGVQSHA